MGYKKFFKHKHYTFPELVRHINEVKRAFPDTTGEYKCGKVELVLKLKPTEISTEYKVKLVAKQDSKTVNIFVINPQIKLVEEGGRVPHLYSNGSLCLFYPNYQEWDYNDSWAETLIPWTSLWLFYYEIWKETSEWMGGGIHGKKNIPFG